MGLSTKNTNIKYVKVIYENNDKDKGKPSFGIQGKVEGIWKVVEQGDNLSGKIIGIEKDSYEFKGKPQRLFKLKVQDNDMNYSLDLGYGYYSRNVLNSLASIGDLTGHLIEFSVYRNKKDYVSIWVTNDGEKTEWDLDAKELPGTDDEKWDESFDYFINKISKNLAPDEISTLGDTTKIEDIEYETPENSPDNKEESVQEEQSEEQEQKEADDLPF